MAGTAINPTPPAGMDAAAGCAVSPSLVNSFRISAIAERLASPNNDASQFFNLCLSLSRGIDYAIANDEVPIKIQSLPVLLKQACQHRNNSLLQAAIMVLMISVKNACKIGWFPAQDSNELLALANEIGSSFCSAGDLNTEVSSSHQTITTIMERFYPRMKMGQMLAFLEVKPGYGTFMIDFHISTSTKPSANNKIWLFVAQIDNLETSSCIISPPQVNFLINGKGVERRTNVFMDTGPQLPTVVMHMLKYGSNLLQAVGEFNGNYIIIVAYMSVVSNPDNHDLKDYFPPIVAAPDSDSELIEGPSRISLICPISLRRIKTPVKGHSCKHHQCFDFDNFVDINSRRPSWRCPHCNQCVCYIDIRIHQNMAKVLKEVGENVTDVIILADGSWQAAAESNDNTDHPNDNASQQDEPVQQKATSFSNVPPDIMDLTEGVDDMDVVHICETQDRKPVLADLRSQSGVTKGTIPPDINIANGVDAAHLEGDFWSGNYFSYGLGASSVRSDAQIVGSASAPAPTNFMLPPVLTDAVSPALNQEPEAFGRTALVAISTPQNQIYFPSNVQLQQSQFGNSIASNEYGSVPSIPRLVNRATIAIQDLPTETRAVVPQQRPRSSFNSLTQGHPLASQTSILPPIADSSNATSITTERQQQFSRSHANPHQASQINSSSLQQRSTSQNWDHQNHPFLPSQVAQQIVVLQAPSQLLGAYRVSTAPPSENQNSHHQQHSNLRATSSLSQPSAGQLPSHFPRTQILLGGTQSGVGQPPVTRTSQMGSAYQAAQMMKQLPTVPVAARQPPSVPVSIHRVSVGDQRGNMEGTLQPSTRKDGLADLPAEHNWRPTGRMRGSLSGPAYSAALNQYIIQQNQAARPPLNNVNSTLHGMSPALHVLLANSRSILASQALDYPPTEPTSTAGGSGFT